MGPPEVTNQEIYNGTLEDGSLHGKIGPRDIRRFEDTLAYVRADAESILDVGCHTGDWLHYVVGRRRMARHLGIDVSPKKIAEAKSRFPELDVRVSFAEQLDLPDRSFDVVTCLEVLEHIQAWVEVLDAMLRLARRQVIVTVPNGGPIIYTPCIHCAKLTPLYGHLRSYTEGTFPQRAGWRLSFGRIRDRDPNRPIEWKVYRFFKPSYPWLLANYEAIADAGPVGADPSG